MRGHLDGRAARGLAGEEFAAEPAAVGHFRGRRVSVERAVIHPLAARACGSPWPRAVGVTVRRLPTDRQNSPDGKRQKPYHPTRGMQLPHVQRGVQVSAISDAERVRTFGLRFAPLAYKRPRLRQLGESCRLWAGSQSRRATELRHASYQSVGRCRTATQMAWPSCGCLTDAAKHRKVPGEMTSMTFVGICTCCCPGVCHNTDRAEYCML